MKTKSKARDLVRLLQYGDGDFEHTTDLAFVACVVEELIIEHTILDVKRIKISLLRRLVDASKNDQ